MTSSGSDRRVHARYLAPYRVVVTPSEGARLATLTDNLSAGGLMLATNHDLPLEQNLDLTIHLPDGQRAVRCHGQVVRRAHREQDGREGFGVQLEFALPADAVDYLKRLNALRAGEVDVAPRAYPVLVVEDNDILSELMATSLPLLWKRRYTYGPFLDIDLAPSGDVALEMVKHRRYNLVVTDVYMPKLDGRAFITALRADARTQSIPVLVISAGDLADEVMALDADGFLRKPLRLRVLFDVVHLLLAGAMPEDESLEQTTAADDESETPLERALRGVSD
ncbi:MAG: response regulator [Pseudomonadota bacterium]